ncbi:uncharacterized protein LOC143020005 [Oratosquilla oratoria]|uniref:uncharacterized protein LOC143020005 n=1 Tax=Oratosquilla oratoria TaxID=337810 RepID=UPI003F76C8BE
MSPIFYHYFSRAFSPIRGRAPGCPNHLSVTSYRDLLHHLPHPPEPEQARDAALYVTVVVVFYVAIIILLVGSSFRRRLTRNTTSGRRHILAYNPANNTATPTLADHHPQLPAEGAVEV